MYNIGDHVEVLDDSLKGTVTAIHGNNITIVTIDGFELDYDVSDLIPLNSDSTLNQNVFVSQSLSEVINDKSSQKRKKQAPKKKERFQPTMEIDLHIEKLTNAYKRMAKHEILEMQLDVAKRQLQSAIQKRIQKIVFIHGVGDGVLKLELEYLFKRFDNIKFYEANYQKYGLGATEVYIPQKVLK